MSHRGRRIAMGVGAGTLAVLGATVLVHMGAIAEEYYLWRLASDDEEARCDAIRWIGRHGSPRAIAAWLSRRLEIFPEQGFMLFDIGEGPRGFEDVCGGELHALELKANGEAGDALEDRLSGPQQRELALYVLVDRRSSARLKVYVAGAVLARLGGWESSVSFDAADDWLAVRALADCVSDPDPVVRAWTACGLRWAPNEEEELALPCLQRLLDDHDPRVRHKAAKALKQIKPGSHEASPR